MAETPPDLQISLVAGHRPDLLERTLASFSQSLFCHFQVRFAVANIDPFMGTDSDGDRCAAIIRDHFPNAAIHRPLQPSFGAAVRHVWSQMPDGLFLHLEDDWVCEAPVLPTVVLPVFHAPDVAAAHLSFTPRRPGRGPVRTRWKRTRLGPITVWRHRVNGWGTSPRFMDGALARAFADAMNPDLDPEKQVYVQADPALCNLIEKYRTIQLWSPDGGPLIRDIGRQARSAVGIEKINLRDGRVIWR